MHGNLNEAARICHKINDLNSTDFYLLKALNLVLTGEINRQNKQFKPAIHYYLKSIEIMDKIGAKCDLAEAYYQLALTNQAMGYTENSKVNFDKAIYIFDEQIKAPKQVEKVQRAMEGK